MEPLTTSPTDVFSRIRLKLPGMAILLGSSEAPSRGAMNFTLFGGGAFVNMMGGRCSGQPTVRDG